MRIAQVAPLAEAVPPDGYGGTELVVSDLTEELVRLGHEVTLFASGDSQTGARLVPIVDEALRLSGEIERQEACTCATLDEVRRRADDFDVVHLHCDVFAPSAADALRNHPLPVPTVATMHGRLDEPRARPLRHGSGQLPLISISDAQRAPLAHAHWLATIQHGMAPDRYRLNPDPGGYLAFLGRIAPEKRPDRAIQIARRAGIPLHIAAKIDEVDRDYFETEIADLMNDPLVRYVGEIGNGHKQDFLGDARALLFPIDWPEPFGLVMIEAMAAGTPVIAWPNGSVPEVVEDGVNGFIVSSEDEAVEAIGRLGELSRPEVRRSFERNYTAERMAKDHVRAYADLIAGERRRSGVRPANAAGMAHSSQAPP